MQADLSSTEPLLDIEILGVNWAGLESANSQATDGKHLPWLQDVDSDGGGGSDAWAGWGAKHLDLVVLDAHNEPLSTVNLIATSLNEQENFSALREALIDAAMENQKPWHNSENPLDVDGSGTVIPTDVLIIINRLNSIGNEKLPPPGLQSQRMFYDANADGDSTPSDALLLVNFLNEQSVSGAGEGESLSLEVLSSLQGEGGHPAVRNWGLPAAEASSPLRQDSKIASFESTTGSFKVRSSENLLNEANTDIVFREEELEWREVSRSQWIAETGQFDGSVFPDGSEVAKGIMG